jgi:hypothetical protein
MVYLNAVGCLGIPGCLGEWEGEIYIIGETCFFLSSFPPPLPHMATSIPLSLSLSLSPWVVFFKFALYRDGLPEICSILFS